MRAPLRPVTACGRRSALSHSPLFPLFNPPPNAGYGGGMSSAKAALESDTKVLAYEAGRK